MGGGLHADDSTLSLSGQTSADVGLSEFQKADDSLVDGATSSGDKDDKVLYDSYLHIWAKSR